MVLIFLRGGVVARGTSREVFEVDVIVHRCTDFAMRVHLSFLHFVFGSPRVQFGTGVSMGSTVHRQAVGVSHG